MKEITKTCSYDINLPVSLRSRRFLFLDIETTGLSSSNSRVYLIGFLYQEGGRWVFTQLFAESPYEERAVLVRAAAFASHFDLFVHFNGCQFDLPYLHGRCVEHGVDDSFMSTPSLDLYLELRGCKKLTAMTIPASVRKMRLFSYVNSMVSPPFPWFQPARRPGSDSG